MNVFFVIILLSLFYIASSNPQNPEINDQYETTTDNTTIKINETKNEQEQTDNAKPVTVRPTEVVKNVFKIISAPIHKILEVPKVNHVLRNVGTCIVNGVMEIVTYYFPAPIIPLIASAAGMMIPFEPIITLRRRMPVTSYRRAFKSAVNGFLNTFNTYKIDNYDDDPYMTRRFNRRFMNKDSQEKSYLNSIIAKY